MRDIRIRRQGQSGVGKTAIAEGLAKKIVDGEVPDVVKECSVYTLDLGTLLAGTKYRGDFEKRFKALLKELSGKPHSILFIDEIHMINDPHRGPTLEVLITLLRQLIKNVQIIGLSATIGNPKELAAWLQANLVVDDWRPVKLHKGVYLNGEIEFS